MCTPHLRVRMTSVILNLRMPVEQVRKERHPAELSGFSRMEGIVSETRPSVMPSFVAQLEHGKTQQGLVSCSEFGLWAHGAALFLKLLVGETSASLQANAMTGDHQVQSQALGPTR